MLDDLKDFGPPPEELQATAKDASQPKRPGKIFTFYSFKGGVGRSMALANIACMIAREGKRVLVVDWDLEAPGLEHFFLAHDPGLAERLTSSMGVIDLLQADRPDWRKCVTRMEIRDIAIDLMHSGKASRDDRKYTEDVRRLDWSRLYTDRDIRIGNYFDTVREEWQDAYDFVLLDSRTGVTDIGDLCTVILPDHLVLLFATNTQNLNGIADIYARALGMHENLDKTRTARSRLTALPVLSRFDFNAEYRTSIQWREKAAERLSHLFSDWLPKDVTPLDAFQKVYIPYFTIWSFSEALPVIEDAREVSNPASINAAYGRIARLMMNDLDWSSLDSIADPAELAETRIRQTETISELREELERERSRREEKVPRVKAALPRYVMLALILLIVPLAIWSTRAYLDSREVADRTAAETAALRNELESERLARQSAEQRLADLRSRMDALSARAGRLAARVSGASRQLGRTADELNAAAVPALQALERVPLVGSKLAGPLEDALRPINDLSRVVARLEAELSALARDAGNSARFDEVSARLQEISAQLDACEARRRELEVDLESLRAN